MQHIHATYSQTQHIHKWNTFTNATNLLCDIYFHVVHLVLTTIIDVVQPVLNPCVTWNFKIHVHQYADHTRLDTNTSSQ